MIAHYIPYFTRWFYMNKQLVFGVIAVVFATALIASSVVDQANAHRSNKQSISQHNDQHQSSTVVTAGTCVSVAATAAILNHSR